MSIEAMKQALEALDKTYWSDGVLCSKAFNALRQALEQPEQEPEAWMGITDNPYCDDADCNNPKGRAMRWHKKLLYLYKQEHAAPKREWVGLTDEELEEIQYSRDTQVEYVTYDEGEDRFEIDIFPENFARAIEAKLKEKNYG